MGRIMENKVRAVVELEFDVGSKVPDITVGYPDGVRFVRAVDTQYRSGAKITHVLNAFEFYITETDHLIVSRKGSPSTWMVSPAEHVSDGWEITRETKFITITAKEGDSFDAFEYLDDVHSIYCHTNGGSPCIGVVTQAGENLLFPVISVTRPRVSRINTSPFW